MSGKEVGEAEIAAGLKPATAQSLLKRLIETGAVTEWPAGIRNTGHSDERRDKWDMSIGDCMNVLRNGKIREAPDWQGGEWRYRVQTSAMVVVVAFEWCDETGAMIVVVTNWRRERSR